MFQNLIILFFFVFYLEPLHCQIFKGGKGDGFDVFTFYSNTTVHEFNQSIDLHISPNPVKCNESIFFSFGCNNYTKIEIEIYNVEGKKIKKIVSEEKQLKFMIEKPGIYFIIAKFEINLISKKIIVLP